MRHRRLRAPSPQPGEWIPRVLTARSLSLAARRVEERHELLAGVCAGEHSHERTRGVVQTFRDGLAVVELVRCDERRELLQRPGPVLHVIADDEALQAHAVGEERWVVLQAIAGAVVVRDDAAERDARERIEAGEHTVHDRAADVFEVDVDAVRGRAGELIGEVVRAVVDASVEAEVVDDVRALRRAARDADRATPAELRELTDDRAHRARRCRHDDGLAGLRFRELEETVVRSHAGHADDTEVGAERHNVRIDRHDPGAVADRV